MENLRRTTWLLTVIMLLCSIAFPAAAEEEMQFLSIVAVEDETVWIHTSHGLVPFDEAGRQAGTALYPGADCYAIGPDGHIYYSIEGDIFEYDRDGTELDKWETPIDNFTKILVNDTYIIIMGDEEYGAIHKENHRLKSGVVEGMQDIGFYNENSFVLLQEGIASLLVQIDCNTLEDIALAPLSHYDGIAFSSEHEGCYVYFKDSIHFLRSLDETVNTYMTLQSDAYIYDMCIGEGTIYILTDEGLEIHARKAEVAKTKVLTIYAGLMWSNTTTCQKARQIFTQRHPEYEVKLTDSVLAEKLNTDLMANAPGYDLMVLEGNNSAMVKASGILAELSENKVITENIDQYLEMPFLWESDGRLYGVPVHVSPFGFKISKALYEQAGLEIERDWTWEDFYALKDAAWENGLMLTSGDRYWQVFRRQYESVYCDYIMGEANYETDAFRMLVTLWSNLEAEEMIAPLANSNILMQYDSMAPVLQNDAKSRGTIFIGMPTLDGEYATPIYMSALYANRHSEHADAAIEFLEIYSSAEVQYESQNMIFLPELENYAEYKWWEMLDTVPTEENMELWKHFLSTGKLFERNMEFDQNIAQLVNALLAERMTIDEFISEVQERADLMVGE